MTKAEKFRTRLMEGQYTGWTFEDLDRVLLQGGFYLVSKAGSHFTYKHPLLAKLLTVKKQPGEIKKGYVREAHLRFNQLESNGDI